MNRLSLKWVLLLVVISLTCLTFTGCTSDDDDDDDVAPADDDAAVGDDDDDDDDDDDNDTPSGHDLSQLQDMFERMDVDRFIGIEPESVAEGHNGYTYFTFSADDCQCTFGGKMQVAIHPGSENKVMLFMEGGGATWPGGGFAVPLDFPWDIGFKSFDPANPLRNWSYVYIPHCDHSIHTGDNELMENGKMRYHHGLKQVGAAVTLMRKYFPHPDKILVAGSSAGGYGTYWGWSIVKSQYMDTDTYIMNDSGTGFWNPDDLESWEVIKEAWNIQVPDDCKKCGGTIQTYMYEVYLKYDPQLRIGMFSSYRDWIISKFFLGMEQDRFEETLMSVTDEIHANYPARFKRFFVQGQTHTTYEFLLPGGPKHKIRGTSLYEWIGQLVNDDPTWRDMLE